MSARRSNKTSFQIAFCGVESTFQGIMLPKKRKSVPHVPAAKRVCETRGSSSEQTVHLRRQACLRDTVQNFDLEEFSPYISSNGHFQTVLSNFFPPAPHIQYSRVRIPTEDGLETLDIDTANGNAFDPSAKDNRPVALVLHGLESCSTGIVTVRLADALVAEDFRVVVMNYRSCAANSGPPKTLRLYHAGFTEDVITVLKVLREVGQSKGSSTPDVYLCGFSLGANIMCNLLRELGSAAYPQFGIIAAYGVGVPYDPTACQAAIDSGVTGMVYSTRLVKSMTVKFQAAIETQVPLGKVNPGKVITSSRIGQIDSNFIAPVFGFNDKYHYYQSVDARKCLQYITVPTLLINSRNDPFFEHRDGKSLPTEGHIGDAPVRVVITESGGHCGFIDHDGFHRKRPMYFQRVCASFCSYIRESRSK